jgi:lipopolysaccharide transport system permease protein
MSAEPKEEWTQVIEPTESVFRINFAELWRYRDLVVLFVRRDFIAVYKQTVLGPFWHFIQPIFTTLVYVFFGSIAIIPTDGFPRVLFCITGVVIWNYFSGCLTKTANTFVSNSGIFGKVYFPRLTVPISIVISNLLSLGIQFLMVVPFLIYFRASIHPNVFILFIPVVILLLAILGFGIGIIISSLTTRYRDLSYLVGFGVQLAVYATPIIYPLSMLKGKLRLLAGFNPVTSLVEVFRYALLGKGTFSAESLAYSALFSLSILFIGIIAFNSSEKTFMDTV